MTAALSVVPSPDSQDPVERDYAQFLAARAETVKTLQSSRGARGREAYFAVYEQFREAIGAKLLAAIRSEQRDPDHPSALHSPTLQAVLQTAYPQNGTDVAHGWLYPELYAVRADTHPAL